MSPTLVQSIALVIFVVAILHTFSVKFFKSLAQKFPRHHNIFEMLGERSIQILYLKIFCINSEEYSLLE